MVDRNRRSFDPPESSSFRLEPETTLSGASLSGASPPRLRIVVGLFSLELGGSQINTIDLASELRRRGHDVTLFVIEDGKQHVPSIEPVAEAASFSIERLPREASVREQARHLTKLADARRADVVHVYHEAEWLGPVGAVAFRSRPRTALVVTNWMMANTRWMPRHASLIVGYPALQKEAARYHQGHLTVLEPPVNVDKESASPSAAAKFRDDIGLAEDDLVVALVTRVDHFMKLDGILLAIRAIGLVDDPRLRLVIVGDGRAMDLVRGEADAANEALGRNAVVIAGAFADPRPAYGAADVVLGMGGSALRGLAFAKPVIVLGEGSFSMPFTEETVEHFFENGMYGTADDDPSGARLAEHIGRAVQPDVRDAMSSFGVEVIRTRYSLETLTTRLETIYEQALRDPPLRRHRWADVAYVLSLDFYHKRIPGRFRSVVRRIARRS